VTPRIPPPAHPAEFSPEVLAVVALYVRRGMHVHDPFAGRGVRLGALCDARGATFTGTDIDVYREGDYRVIQADSSEEITYPFPPFTVVTSPVYTNRISVDYVDGPTPTTKVNGRRSYGICLGRALHPRNFARAGRHLEDYYELHAEAVRHWSTAAFVNVDAPMLDGWTRLLERFNYRIDEVIEVGTRRYRGLANSDIRADHEVVIVARQGGTP
jgi:hypothetical protein